MLIVLHERITTRGVIQTTMGNKTKTAGRKPKAKFSITFYRAWCKECGICGEFCPTHAIVCDELGRPRVADADACINCHNCEYRCPDFAVTIAP